MYNLELTDDELNALQEMVGTDTEHYVEHNLSSMRSEIHQMRSTDQNDYEGVIQNYFGLVDSIESVQRKVNSLDKQSKVVGIN